MTDIMTDSKSITITVKENGIITISNLDFPTVVRKDKLFDIVYVATNTGGDETCYGKIMDKDNTVVDRWEETIGKNGTKNCTHTISLSDIGQNNLTLEVGYVD